MADASMVFLAIKQEQESERLCPRGIQNLGEEVGNASNLPEREENMFRSRAAPMLAMAAMITLIALVFASPPTIANAKMTQNTAIEKIQTANAVQNQKLNPATAAQSAVATAQYQAKIEEKLVAATAVYPNPFNAQPDKKLLATATNMTSLNANLTTVSADTTARADSATAYLERRTAADRPELAADRYLGARAAPAVANAALYTLAQNFPNPFN